MGEMRNTFSKFWSELEAKRPLGKPRHICENIRMDLKERWKGVD
jgi:hypothetical protein